MPQDPTRYPVVQPMAEGDGTPSQPWRTWEQRVSKTVPIVGAGSPEGVVEALQYATYVDETDPSSPTIYRKMLPNVGGDKSKGWVDAITLSDLTADTLAAGEITADTLTVTDIYRDVVSGDGDRIGAAGDFGWHDMLGDIVVRGNRSVDPAWAQIGSGPFYGYRFDGLPAAPKEIQIVYHVPHDIASSSIYFHTHYLADGTDTNPVRWEFTYSYAKGFDQEAFNTTGTTVTVDQAPSGTAYQHMVAETSAQTISGLTEPDGLIICRIRRITNGATENTDNVYLLKADIHYQSTNLPTKNKAPGFYT